VEGREDGGRVTTADPYRPPRARVADAPALGLELATRSQRFRAFLVDAFIHIVLGLLLISPWLWSEGIQAASNRFHGSFPIFFGFLAHVILNAYLLHKYGQTIGKRIVGTRIVRTNGDQASLPRIVGLRMGFLFFLNLTPHVGGVLWLADILFIFRRDHRCVHDHVAGTMVVVA
jgi:uncharacterized RDD family membrane protein YckC